MKSWIKYKYTFMKNMSYIFYLHEKSSTFYIYLYEEYEYLYRILVWIVWVLTEYLYEE